jgi:hypothetical protein
MDPRFREDDGEAAVVPMQGDFLESPRMNSHLVSLQRNYVFRFLLSLFGALVLFLERQQRR